VSGVLHGPLPPYDVDAPEDERELERARDAARARGAKIEYVDQIVVDDSADDETTPEPAPPRDAPLKSYRAAWGRARVPRVQH